jgi:PAS domain S-box-containing protein
VDSQQFNDKVEQLRAGFESIYTAFEQIPESTQAPYPELYALLRTTLKGLETTLEELSVAEEELRQQNEELALTRQSIEAERQRYQELFEFAPHGYLVTDAAGKILEANQAASLLFNVPQEFLIGKLLAIYISSQDKKRFREKLNQLSANAVEHLADWEIHIEPRDADPFIASLTVRSNTIAPESGHLRWMIRDITRTKRMQSELDETRRRLIESVEDERTRLARELHDGPVQDLYALTYQFSTLRESIKDEQGQASYARIRADLRRIINALKSRSVELRPPTLDPFGFNQAVASYTQIFRRRNRGLEVSLNLYADGQRLSKRAQLAIFRIYQQGLMNVVRHARATKVVVNFTQTDREIQLSIHDNGTGFDVPQNWIQLVRRGHLGLVGCNERAAAVGGKFEVESEPGEGTLLKVVLPRSPSQGDADQHGPGS